MAPPAEREGPQGKKLVSDIEGISIREESSSVSGGSQNKSFLWKDKVDDNSIRTQQGTVGSLTFNVIDTSSTKNASNPSKGTTSTNAATLVKNSGEQKSAGRKAAPRAKVPFEKGYSQMDWLKLTRTHPDLAGTLYLLLFPPECHVFGVAIFYLNLVIIVLFWRPLDKIETASHL